MSCADRAAVDAEHLRGGGVGAAGERRAPRQGVAGRRRQRLLAPAAASAVPPAPRRHVRTATITLLWTTSFL